MRRLSQLLILTATSTFTGCGEGQSSPDSQPSVKTVTVATPVRASSTSTLRTIQPRIEKAERDSSAAANRVVDEVNRYLASRKRFARQFAQATLSYEAKFKALGSAAYAVEDVINPDHPRLWGTMGRDPLGDHVKKSFEKIVLDHAELQKFVETTVASYVGDVRRIENQLLIDVRADVGDDWLTDRLAVSGLSSLREKYEASIHESAEAVRGDVNASLAVEIANFYVGNIVSDLVLGIGQSLASEMGVSGALSGFGASSGVVTFGIGFVISQVIDAVIQEILKLGGYDAETRVIAKVTSVLDQVRLSMVESDKGLMNQVKGLDLQRSRLRRLALEQLFMKGGAR